MRKIEGFVCTVRFTQPRTQELLFGPNTGGSEFNHQKFTTNELTPFDSQECAVEGLEGLRIRKNLLGYTRLGLATLNMELTSSDNEWDILKGHNNYIVVAGVDGGYILLGKSVEGVPGVAHAPVSDLERNGFKTIRDFDFLTDSWGIVSEVRRQGRPYTSQIATFELKRLKLI
jgi:hypothetical protein